MVAVFHELDTKSHLEALQHHDDQSIREKASKIWESFDSEKLRAAIVAAEGETEVDITVLEVSVEKGIQDLLGPSTRPNTRHT